MPAPALPPASATGSSAGGGAARAIAPGSSPATAPGLHVLVADARDGYAWRTAATLVESGFDADQWIGNACQPAPVGDWRSRMPHGEREISVRSLRRRIGSLVLVLVVALAGSTVGAGPASAAPGIDPDNGNFAQWMFHSGGNYDLVIDAFDFGGDGGTVGLANRNGSSAQLWFQEGGTYEAYFHPGYNRWLCMGRNSTWWGETVRVQNCNGSPLQRWNVLRYTAQYYTLQAWDDTSLCVDVVSSNYSHGQRLQLWGCNSGAGAQTWPTARCHGSGCEGYKPFDRDCQFAGSYIGKDVSEDGTRVWLTFARGCQSIWASGRKGGSIGPTIQNRMFQDKDFSRYSYFSAGGATNETITTAMWSTATSGRDFKACMDLDGTKRYALCTGIF